MDILGEASIERKMIAYIFRNSLIFKKVICSDSTTNSKDFSRIIRFGSIIGIWVDPFAGNFI